MKHCHKCNQTIRIGKHLVCIPDDKYVTRKNYADDCEGYEEKKELDNND